MKLNPPLNPERPQDGQYWDDCFSSIKTFKDLEDVLDWFVAYFVPRSVLRVYRNIRYRIRYSRMFRKEL